MAQVRANELWKDQPSEQHAGARSNKKTAKEQRFSAHGGKLFGSPDLVRDNEVIDFKSGQVFEDENAEIVKEQYLRQLRIYGLLVYENLGWWPERGILLPMNGSRVEVQLDPDECKKEAQQAVELLASYNQSCAVASNPSDLASPSAETCKWCPYQSICPAYWESINDEWAINNTGCVEGTLTEAPLQIHNGLAYSLSLFAERGSTEVGAVKTFFPFDSALYSDIQLLQSQDRIRLTGLVRRSDGSLASGKRTLLAKVDNLPEIVFENENANGFT
ncbi:MAG: PD-(D/E)XK nuclease family protein [Candidatus Obscuribacter sp.]|nr:PD-(D/E)XK nuclease family protein [Candidatus Obscuribacter sp.]